MWVNGEVDKIGKGIRLYQGSGKISKMVKSAGDGEMLLTVTNGRIGKNGKKSVSTCEMEKL